MVATFNTTNSSAPVVPAKKFGRYKKLFVPLNCSAGSPFNAPATHTGWLAELLWEALLFQPLLSYHVPTEASLVKPASEFACNQSSRVLVANSCGAMVKLTRGEVAVKPRLSTATAERL